MIQKNNDIQQIIGKKNILNKFKSKNQIWRILYNDVYLIGNFSKIKKNILIITGNKFQNYSSSWALLEIYNNLGSLYKNLNFLIIPIIDTDKSNNNKKSAILMNEYFLKRCDYIISLNENKNLNKFEFYFKIFSQFKNKPKHYENLRFKMEKFGLKAYENNKTIIDGLKINEFENNILETLLRKRNIIIESFISNSGDWKSISFKHLLALKSILGFFNSNYRIL